MVVSFVCGKWWGSVWSTNTNGRGPGSAEGQAPVHWWGGWREHRVIVAGVRFVPTAKHGPVRMRTEGAWNGWDDWNWVALVHEVIESAMVECAIVELVGCSAQRTRGS